VCSLAAFALVLLGLAAPALGASPAWELTSIHGPTNVPLQPSANEVVTVKFHANDGKFYLEFHNEETGEEGETALLPYNATAAEVQDALERLRHGEPRSAIARHNVVVTGGYDEESEEAAYTIEFVGELGDRYLEEAFVPGGPLELESGGITEHEESQFEREEEKRGGTREPEEPEGQATVTRAGYHDTVDYRVSPANRGAAPSSGTIELKDELPAGLSTRQLPEGQGWACEKPRVSGESEKEVEKERRAEEKRDGEEKLPEGSGLQAVECAFSGVVNADGVAPPVVIEAYAETTRLQGETSLENTASVEGGGAAEVVVHESAQIDSTPAPFGLQVFSASTSGEGGEAFTQAGGHPYAATTGLFFNTVPRVEPASKATEVAVSGRVKDADVKLPAGFLGNPLATERCSQADFTKGVTGGPDPGGSCPPDSQVGTAEVYLGDFLSPPEPVGVYDLVPPPGVPAEFGFIFKDVPVRLDARVVHETGDGGEYRVTVLSADINEAYNLYGVQLTLWGVPGGASHTPERFKSLFERGAAYEGTEKPFLFNPVDCVAQADALESGSNDANLAPITSAVVDSWERQGALNAKGDPENPGPNWSAAEAASPKVSGCEALTFEPQVAFAPRLEESEGGAVAGTTQAGAPSGYKFELSIPQKEAIGELATPELRDATVTLPEGLVLSPSAANGLVACTAEDIDLESTARGNCPGASEIGSVSIESQLLEKPLPGRVYVGEPECHPCDSAQVAEGKLLKLYIEAEEAGAPEAGGVRVKLPGFASVNQQTGQVTTTFANNPQLPFEKLTLKLKGGPRAPLANPEVCSPELNGSALLTPWSLGGATPGGETVTGSAQPAAISSPGFSITGCPASLPFSPSFNAGAEDSKAGAYSNFDVTFSRHDGEQDLSGVTVQVPPGLLGKIKGISRCEGVAAESSQVECSPAARIGTATSAAGAGSEPYVVSGPVYLTGGYDGAPFGLKIAVPADAGPFELGTVVVRAAINIDKTTSAITVTSQPLPQGIDGIPFRLKTVNVDVNRPEFMFNPTNCETQAISADLTGEPAKAGEAPVGVERSAQFTASDCAALPFAPTFTASTDGITSKLDGASLTVTVTQHPGEADIRKVELQLPEALPSRNETLNKACTQKQFAANPSGCPEASVVGTATAHTPLLSVPLTGPAYLVSRGGAAFPDLIFLLQGEGVFIELVGNTDIKKIDGKEITFSKFETVPDAPISSFETNLPEGRHSVLDFYGEFCKKEVLFAPTKIVAQNNAHFEQDTKVAVTGCPPTVSITSTQVKANKLVLTLKLSQRGTVKVSGKAINGVEKTLRAGTSTLTLNLNKTGKNDARRHKKLSVTASLTVGKQDSVTTATVKA
jgi:hypothetical protein